MLGQVPVDRGPGHSERVGNLLDGVAALVVHRPGLPDLRRRHLELRAALPAPGAGGREAVVGAFDDEVVFELRDRSEHVEEQATALLQRLAAVRGRLSLCADQAAAAKWWLSMPMASVSAEGPMPKALSTRRTSPLMPGCRHQGRACPLRRARMTSNPLIVA